MFRLLYRSYATNCWRVAFRITKDESMAEDAVQNAFILAFQKLGTFKKESSFKTWLIRIVIHESLKLIKANSRYLHLENNEVILENDQDIFKLSDELLKLEKNELQQLLHAALATLPQAMQLLLQLFYLEEMSIKEIVEATELSVANVKTGLHRARKELKTILDKKINFA